MIIHYIKIAIRNLARQKTLAMINIIGLSVGLACFSLFLFIPLTNSFSTVFTPAQLRLPVNQFIYS